MTRPRGAALSALTLLVAAGAASWSSAAQARGPLVQRFVSRPDLRPPAVRVRTASAPPANGLIFVAPKAGAGQAGPMLLDERGRLVWFRDLAGALKAFNFRAQTYRGRPVLSWWQGKVTGSYGTGVNVIADGSYRVIKKVQAGRGLKADLHEFVLTPRGTAYLTAYRPMPYDLRPVGGP